MQRLRPIARTGRLAAVRHEVLGTIVMLAHPIETATALRDPNVARAFSPFLRRARPRLVMGTAVLVTGAGFSRRFAPRLLPPMAAGLAALIAGERWRTSSARAARHHWPPGRRGITPLSLVSPTLHRDRARRYGDVFTTNQFDRPTACLLGTAASADFLRTHADELERAPQQVYRFIPGGFLRRMVGAEHKHERAQLGAALSTRVVEEATPSLRAGFDAMFGRLAAIGETGAPARPAIEDTVFELMQHVFFGIPLDSPLLVRLRQHNGIIDPLNRSGPSDADIEAAFSGAATLIAGHVAEHAGGAGLPPCVLREVLRRQPDALTDTHTMRSLLLFALNGSWDITGLVTWMWKHLSDHRAWTDALRADLASGADQGAGSLADHLVSETLRLEQSEYLNLMVGREIHHDGYVVPPGWGLRVCVAENHRDPILFDHPDEYRPDRWTERRYPRTEYAPFGMDHHACLGETLTRAIGRAFAVALAAGYDWAVLDDGPREVSTRQHWAPNSRFRVAVTRRAPEPAGPSVGS